MESFTKKFAGRIKGILSGFDRMVFRGTLRELAFPGGMAVFLSVAGLLRCQFGKFAEQATKQIVAASLERAEREGRPVIFVKRGDANKEEIARRALKESPIEEGLICVLKAVERCNTFGVIHTEKGFMMGRDHRKCLHLYHYFLHPTFGFMNVRLQTWFPFTLQICINGREWLARSMDRDGLRYDRLDNCFPWIQDFARAQALADAQVQTAWETLLDPIGEAVNPALREVLGRFQSSYYWSLMQSEWATDISFNDLGIVPTLHRQLSDFAITHLGSADVIRFLGREPDPRFRGQIVSDFKDRHEGARVKHWVDHNSVKLYDKASDLLRVETTINQARAFKVFRHKQGDPDGEKSWRVMRQGIADLPARAEVSHKSNERYLEALAAADTTAPLGNVLQPLSLPVTWKGHRARGLRPWSPDDVRLIQAVSRGEFAMNGFRNKDLVSHLFDSPPVDDKERLSRSHKVTRLIRLLRAHAIIRKVPRASRYRLSKKGLEIAPLLLRAQRVTLAQIERTAA